MEENWLYTMIKEFAGYIVAAGGGIAWFFAWRDRTAATKLKEANAKLMEAQAALEENSLMGQMQAYYDKWLNHYTREQAQNDLKMQRQEEVISRQGKEIDLMKEEIRMLNLTLKAQRELCEACPNSNILLPDTDSNTSPAN